MRGPPWQKHDWEAPLLQNKPWHPPLLTHLGERTVDATLRRPTKPCFLTWPLQTAIDRSLRKNQRHPSGSGHVSCCPFFWYWLYKFITDFHSESRSNEFKNRYWSLDYPQTVNFSSKPLPVWGLFPLKCYCQMSFLKHLSKTNDCKLQSIHSIQSKLQSSADA